MFRSLLASGSPWWNFHQPAVIGGIARVFDLAPPPLATARILQLGCGEASQLLSLARAYPRAQILGLDLSQARLARLREEAAVQGLANLTLKAKAQWELEDLGGPFDYIICDGVYSAVRSDLQDTLLELIARNLAPEGLAAVSYKVLPGWRYDKPLREAFNALLVPGLEGAERNAAALELAEFLKTATQGQGSYGAVVAAWADLLHSCTATALAEDVLCTQCQPTTFAEFAAHAAAARLGYVGDADLPMMITKRLPPQIAAAVARRCGRNQVATEQMLDLLTGRAQRISLLVHGRRVPEMRRKLSPDVLQGLHLAAAPGLEIRNSGGETSVLTPRQEEFILTDPMLRDALAQLSAVAPASRHLDELAPPAAGQALREGLYPLLLAGAIIPLSAAQSAKCLKPLQ